MTEAAAKAAGKQVRVGRFPFIGNAKRLPWVSRNALMKTVFDAKTGELRGAHMVGPD